MKTNVFALLGLLISFIVAPPLCAAPGNPLPGDSIYHLATPLIDQDARRFDIAELRGKVVVTSLFYTSCPYMCPLIIDTLRQTERALDDEERARLNVLLITLDTKRDDPAALKAQAQKRKIDTARWTLARTESADVRKYAAAIDIAYRELPNGEFSHASTLVLLDREGRIVARTDTMGKIDADFVEAIRRQLKIP